MSSFRRGVRLLLAHKKAVFFAYAANLLAASVLFFPFAADLDASLGSGRVRTEMVDKIDYDWYSLIEDRGGELLRTFSPAVTGAGPFARNLDALVTGKLFELPDAIWGAAALYLVLNAFLTAAALGSFSLDPKGTSFREFLRTGGEFFGRFFRLTLLALFCFGMLYGWIQYPATELIDGLTADMTVDRTVFFWYFGAFLVLWFLFTVLNMVMDYAKIVTSTEDRASVFLAVLSGLTFCVAYGPAAFGLHLLLGLTGLAWMVLCLLAEQWIPQAGWWGIAAAFAVQQIFIVGRLGVRYLFYTAQMEFFLEREKLYRPERDADFSPLSVSASLRENTRTDS